MEVEATAVFCSWVGWIRATRCGVKKRQNNYCEIIRCSIMAECRRRRQYKYCVRCATVRGHIRLSGGNRLEKGGQRIGSYVREKEMDRGVTKRGMVG